MEEQAYLTIPKVIVKGMMLERPDIISQPREKRGCHACHEAAALPEALVDEISAKCGPAFGAGEHRAGVEVGFGVLNLSGDLLESKSRGEKGERGDRVSNCRDLERNAKRETYSRHMQWTFIPQPPLSMHLRISLQHLLSILNKSSVRVHRVDDMRSVDDGEVRIVADRARFVGGNGAGDVGGFWGESGS